MMGKSGLALAILMTCRIPSTEPGLNATCLMPAFLSPSMISAAFSVLGIPAATQKPSFRRPSFRISCNKDCADEACFDGCGSHPGDHDGQFAQESRERRVEVDHSIAARDIK